MLVNNAAVTRHASFIDHSFDDWDELISINLTAPFELSQHAAKRMIKQGHGKIIHIASMAGIKGTRGGMAYAVAKAGLIHMTKCMSNELASHNIQVNAVAPGFIETDMLPPSFRDKEHEDMIRGLIPANRFGTPQEVANAVAFLASDKADYITGACLVVDGGWLGR